MITGRVKWFNRDKGYGFIETDTYQHVFVDYTCIENGYRIDDLKESEEVFVEVQSNFRGPQAIRVRRMKNSL